MLIVKCINMLSNLKSFVKILCPEGAYLNRVHQVNTKKEDKKVRQNSNRGLNNSKVKGSKATDNNKVNESKVSDNNSNDSKINSIEEENNPVIRLHHIGATQARNVRSIVWCERMDKFVQKI